TQAGSNWRVVRRLRITSSSASQRVRVSTSRSLGVSRAISNGGAPLGGLVVLVWRVRFTEQLRRARRRKGLDVLQLSCHLTSADLSLSYRLGHRLQLFFRLRQDIAEFSKLGLHGGQQFPHFTRTPLDRKRAEAHLQRTQRGRKIIGTGNGYAVFPLHEIGKTRSTDYLCVQPFGGDEQKCEVGCMWRADIFLVNGLRLELDAIFQRFPRILQTLRVSSILRREQALIVFGGKRGVDRQPHRFITAASRQSDRKFDALGRARQRRYVHRVLVRSQHLLQQRGELHFTPGAARFHIRQDALEIAHAGRQRLHLTEPLVYLL